MKDIKNAYMKKCIFMAQDDFVLMIDDLFNGRFKTTFSLDGIDISDENDSGYESNPEFLEKLAIHFDVEKITSIHIDDCEYPIGVWIVIKDKEEQTKPITNEFAELKGQIVDIFEDFLDAKEITIHNPEADEDTNAENPANIYGTDYDTIANEVDFMIGNEYETGHALKFAPSVFNDVIDTIFNSFIRVFTKYYNENTTEYLTIRKSEDELKINIKSVLNNWNIMTKS